MEDLGRPVGESIGEIAGVEAEEAFGEVCFDLVVACTNLDGDP